MKHATLRPTVCFFMTAVCLLFVPFDCLVADEPQEDARQPVAKAALTGPAAALAFELSFQDPDRYRDSKPVHLNQCKNITELTDKLWSKKDVLTDFKKHRTEGQIGVIVFLKTEFCCDGSRLCAVTTACLEKQSTPLVSRFRVYSGWIKNHPDLPDRNWSSWDDQVIEEYGFVQGPGARVAVMVPTWDGKMYQWHSNATRLELSQSEFEQRQGRTPALERFLAEAIKYAPQEIPPVALSRK